MAAKETRRRFTMDTDSFLHILANHLPSKMPTDDAWNRFVLNLFDRFTEGTEYKNMETMKQEDADWQKWDDNKKYLFMSDKVYSKCIGLRRRLKEEKGFTLKLPQGYLTRNGTKTSKRLTSDDMIRILTGE